MYRPQPMQNQRPKQEERRLTLQETMLQYMSHNDIRMKLVESQLSNIQSFLSQR